LSIPGPLAPADASSKPDVICIPIPQIIQQYSSRCFAEQNKNKGTEKYAPWTPDILGLNNQQQQAKKCAFTTVLNLKHQ